MKKLSMKTKVRFLDASAQHQAKSIESLGNALSQVTAILSTLLPPILDESLDESMDGLFARQEELNHSLDKKYDQILKEDSKKDRSKKPTKEQIVSVCMTFRNDYETFSLGQKDAFKRDAELWLRAWQKEGFL